MDWGNLFFKFSGRINRAKYWIAALVYFVINVVFSVIGALTESIAFQALNGMVSIVLLISALAVGIKRLHDRDKSGWYLVLFYIVPGILITVAVAMYMTMDDATTVSTVLGLITVGIGVWAFVELGCLRGTVGANKYGPDPIAPATVPPIRTPV